MTTENEHGAKAMFDDTASVYDKARAAVMVIIGAVFLLLFLQAPEFFVAFVLIQSGFEDQLENTLARIAAGGTIFLVLIGIIWLGISSFRGEKKS